MKSNTDILVFSHLRWEFVYQRPQHLLSRMASSYRIMFIEEPEFSPHTEAAEARFSSPAPNILVCRPRTPSNTQGFHPEQIPYLRALLREIIADKEVQDYILWFYTPMAGPLAEELRPLAIIYDCMDELSGFLNAPPELADREAALLERADAVFTGGPSLYRAKRDRHPNVYCEPSSVDTEHFAKAIDGGEAADQSGLCYPRLGYCGVIDERIDLDVLRHLAEQHPEWNIIMLGPVVKINSDSLPRLPNIRYFGQRSYEDLPYYLRGWDVCLLPFARNAATKYISPTKTLEYMAANKPIVSTPITDVAEPYGDIVYLGGTPAEFLACCEQALRADDAERAARWKKMARILRKTSWTATAERMRGIMEAAVERNLRERETAQAVRVLSAASGPPDLSPWP